MYVESNAYFHEDECVLACFVFVTTDIKSCEDENVLYLAIKLVHCESYLNRFVVKIIL